MEKIWSDIAWAEYVAWQTQDKKLLEKINRLLDDIGRNGPDKGLGKPERLRANRSGLWSRRIDDKHRLVYSIEDGRIYVASCEGHYGNK